MTTSAKPNNASWVAPYIIVNDVNKAADFYAKAFGFEKVFENEGEGGIITHAELKYKDQALMLGKAGAYGGTIVPPSVSGVESPMNLYFYTENVDDFFTKAKANGAKVLGEPEEMFWGDRMCRLQDIDGYTWCVATHIPGKALSETK